MLVQPPLSSQLLISVPKYKALGRKAKPHLSPPSPSCRARCPRGPLGAPLLVSLAHSREQGGESPSSPATPPPPPPQYLLSSQASRCRSALQTGGVGGGRNPTLKRDILSKRKKGNGRSCHRMEVGDHMQAAWSWRHLIPGDTRSGTRNLELGPFVF